MSVFDRLRPPAVTRQTGGDMDVSMTAPHPAPQSAFGQTGLRLAALPTWTPLTMPVPPPAETTPSVPRDPARSHEDPRNLGTAEPPALTLWIVPNPSLALSSPAPASAYAARMARLARAIDATHAPVGSSTGLLLRVAGLLVAMTVVLAAYTTLALAAQGGATLQIKAAGGAYSIELGAKPAPPAVKPSQAAAPAKPPT